MALDAAIDLTWFLHYDIFITVEEAENKQVTCNNILVKCNEENKARYVERGSMWDNWMEGSEVDRIMIPHR
jgi:hypothetical protein